LTTHYLEEAEALCQRIAMLKQGKVVALDTTPNLLSRFGGTKKQNGETVDLEDVFVHIMSGNAA
jgi:ABC-2 type transport system ATP-binding protein